MTATSRFLPFLLLAFACIAPRASAQQPDKKNAFDIKLAQQGKDVLLKYCSKCHGGLAKNAGLDVGDRDAMAKDKFIIPGKPDESPVWKMMTEKNDEGKTYMPPQSVPLRPDDKDKEVIRKWIEDGAEFVREQRPFLTEQDIIALILKDIRQYAPARDQQYIRYFSLAHVWNNPKVSDRDLDFYRAGLVKLLNSLTFRRETVRVRHIDPPYNTVFAVDLRHLVDIDGYDWSQTDNWDRLLSIYPYGVVLPINIRKQVKDIFYCQIPYIRADWFVFAAARPDPYHLLLGLPDNARTLEKKLKVDIVKNFAANKLWRAGIPPGSSGVSPNYRLVERHETDFGAYWKSYDFGAQAPDNKDLSKAPLGPIAVKGLLGNGNQGFAYDHDGGEIIFNLPNGQQAYLLATGDDRRIDSGPPNIVSDKEGHSAGDTTVVNGISCFGCHKAGMRQFKDTVREQFNGLNVIGQKVLEVYPEQEMMDKLVKQDIVRFQRANMESIGPYLRTTEQEGVIWAVFSDRKVVKANQQRLLELKKPLTELSKHHLAELETKLLDQLSSYDDPIARLSLAYDKAVTVDQAALELGLANADKLKIQAGGATFRSLGLGAWGNPGGTVSRPRWEETFRQVAREILVLDAYQPSTDYRIKIFGRTPNHGK